jgi:alpha-L-fucosidase
LLPDADVKRLQEFGTAIQQRYALNLIARNHISSPSLEPAIDADLNTFWSAPAGSHHSWLNDGQHVQHYRIEAWDGRTWKALAEGRAIGHKRIDSFPAVTTSRVRLNILESSAEAHIREFQVFHVALK